MKCPNCGREASGRFCSACGASLEASSCPECGASLVPGARFCNSCGTEIAATGRSGAASRRSGSAARRAGAEAAPGSNLPWYIAGAVLLVLIIVLGYPLVTGGDDVPARGTAPLTGPGAPPPLTGTPREQADRLFNRVMTAREAGNMAEARQFAPMAVDAYRMAQPLDDDGLYHLAAMHNVLGDHAEARATAERILERNPNHLLGLAIAAEALEQAGDRAGAREYHQRLLAAYDAEVGRPLPEYQDHARILPEYRAAAQAAVGPRRE